LKRLVHVRPRSGARAHAGIISKLLHVNYAITTVCQGSLRIVSFRRYSLLPSKWYRRDGLALNIGEWDSINIINLSRAHTCHHCESLIDNTATLWRVSGCPSWSGLFDTIVCTFAAQGATHRCLCLITFLEHTLHPIGVTSLGVPVDIHVRVGTRLAQRIQTLILIKWNLS